MAKKFFDWFDILRILKNMESPSIDESRSSTAYGTEYAALFASWYVLSDYFLNYPAPTRTFFLNNWGVYEMLLKGVGYVSNLIIEWGFTKKVVR